MHAAHAQTATNKFGFLLLKVPDNLLIGCGATMLSCWPVRASAGQLNAAKPQ